MQGPTTTGWGLGLGGLRGKTVVLSLWQKLLAFPWLVHGDGLGGCSVSTS